MNLNDNMSEDEEELSLQPARMYSECELCNDQDKIHFCHVCSVLN